MHCHSLGANNHGEYSAIYRQVITKRTDHQVILLWTVWETTYSMTGGHASRDYLLPRGKGHLDLAIYKDQIYVLRRRVVLEPCIRGKQFKRGTFCPVKTVITLG